MPQKQTRALLSDYIKHSCPQPPFILPEFTSSCHQVERWWNSRAKIKLLCGGNQSGKSTTGGAYVAHILRSQPGGKSWACALDFQMTSILYDKLMEYLAPEEIHTIVWASRGRNIPFSLTHHNGHTVFFKSMDASPSKFEGEQISGIIWIDEECPKKVIYTSCLARTTKYGAPIIMTMTPLKGKTWVYHDIFQLAANRKAVQADKRKTNIYAETLSLYDNIFLPRERIDEVVDAYSEDEIPYRVFGKWAQLSGRVYPKFRYETSVIPYTQDLLGSCHTILKSIDFGRWKAVTWLGIDHNENVYVLREWKEAEYTLSEMADAIDRIESEMERRTDDTITDHAFQERYELEQYGIHCALADKSIRKGIEIMNRRIQHSSFFVCDSCPKTIAELEEYIYKEGTPEPKKGQDDHLADTVRYNVTESEQYCSGKFGDIPRIDSVAKSEVG